MDRRFFLTIAAALAGSNAAVAADGMTSSDAWFTDWLDSFYGRALVAGFKRSLLDSELKGLSPDPRVTALDARQPEFARPVSDYVRGVVTADRITIGRSKRQTIGAFPKIEQTYGAPREILIAIWAMESGFGALQGDFDVVRSLATLAAAGRRRGWAEDQLFACLRILATGEVTRNRLRGSWAGAMGQTQLLPSTFLTAGVDGDGDGRRDIWGSAADALASAANLLAKGGWRRGEGWAREAMLRPGFDYSLSEGPKETPSWWAGQGAKRADGLAWTVADAAAPCVLIAPSGAGGPAFLLLPNHFVIRTYNNSVAYALSVGFLADRFAGGGPLHTAWPHETPLSLTERLDAQTALAKLGYNPGQADGVVGLATRQALRAWQKSQGLTADGYLSPEMVRRLKSAAQRA
ncbi:MAG TPA: lytic murein transglycosylase [Caulobacteraceae bacterium]